MKNALALLIGLAGASLAFAGCKPPPHPAARRKTPTTGNCQPTGTDRMAVLVPYMPQPSDAPPALGDYQNQDGTRFLFHYVPPADNDDDQGNAMDEGGGDAGGGGEE